MINSQSQSKYFYLAFLAAISWVVPGSGYLFLKETKRAIIIFVTITVTFILGIYVGSIGVIDPVSSTLWYIPQIMNSPFVAMIGQITAQRNMAVFGKPLEIGQIYTAVSGLLNLLCIFHIVQMAYNRSIQGKGVG